MVSIGSNIMVRNISQLQPAVNETTERLQGRDAQKANFSAGQALAEVIRTTFGPSGMDKMLISSEGKVIVTNDGASILDRIEINHPAAEMVIRVAETQADATGDGTTTAVILTSELLGAAEALIDHGLHPTTIANGYQLAAERVLETLEKEAIGIDAHNPDRLRDIVRTVITGKWEGADAQFLAEVAVEAVQAIEHNGTVDRRNITNQAVAGGGYRDSEVIDGIVIDLESSSTSIVSPETELPRQIEDATIALIDDQLTIETVDGLGTVSLDTPEQRQAFLDYEDEVYEKYVATIADAGADVVFCQKSIDDPIRYLLARENIIAIERTRKDELIKLGHATGAQYVGTVDELTAMDTGHAGLVERRSVGNRELAIVSECLDSKQVSILLRGGTKHINEEMKRVLDDCLDALILAIETQVVLPGGGAVEVMLADDLRKHAEGISEREQLAIEAFGDALETLPRTLAKNAGMDPIDALIDVRRRQHEGNVTVGLDILNGEIGDMMATGVLEPLAIKQRAITNAYEAATMLIRIDDIIAAAPDTDTDGDNEEQDSDTLHAATGGYPWSVGHSMGGHGHAH
jgi:chaperonin GroEL (HSP60 family)